MKRLLCIAALLPILGLLPACASDFISDPSHPRPTRAVQDPSETNTPSGEVRAGNEDAVPIVTVTASNKPGENPRVRTIADNVRDTLNPPAAATGPTDVSTPGQPAGPTPTGVKIDPVTGAAE